VIDMGFFGGMWGYVFDYLAFMDAEYAKCPYCEELIKRNDVKKHYDEDKNAIVCPNCTSEIEMDELRSGFEL